MNKTVAIVGTSDRTRKFVPFQNNNVDIWVFNSMVVQEWVPRCDVVFDMHKFETFDTYEKIYVDWLKSNNKKQIFYTQSHDDRFPQSTPYPFDEIMADLLPNFVRGEDELPIAYFTSSVCYALALAIHKGYERIEFWGIDMASNTEYIYQRDGIALFMGIAIARGIKVYIPQDCAMFAAPLYGYDDNLHDINWELLDQLATALVPVMEKSHSKLESRRGKMNAIQTEVIEANTRGDKPEVLQEIAKRYEDAVNEYDQSIADYANLHGQYMTLRNLQIRAGKQMEAAGDAQRVLAINDEMKPR